MSRTERPIVLHKQREGTIAARAIEYSVLDNLENL